MSPPNPPEPTRVADASDPSPPSSNPTIRLSLPDGEQPGERIGRYKLLQPIGEGGMGSVWMAEQEEPVRRRVALKVIKLGMDTKEVIGRFEAERQALALMDHPNIAKVLDAGATDNGRPFFVMELVKGIRITDYCDQNSLSTSERLGLFIQVCQAIQHAHQKGVIHRDIKPSNILVTLNDRVLMPKVIDFGIAKATTGQALTDKTVFTAFEQFIGTPAYMSPEQAEMNSLDIDTRSDIYALGVLLYELLTGKTPFDAKELLAKGVEEMRRIIREREPMRPSTRISTLDAAEQTVVAKQRRSEPPKLLGLIRGDLDWIVLKTLEKDRTRRYDTANGLAMDIQRYLNTEPIVARPPSASYRFQKMLRRNKLTVAVTGAVAVSLLIGIGVSTVMFFKEKAARTQTEVARQNEAGLRQKAQAAEKSAQTLAELRRLNNQAMLMAQFSGGLGNDAAAASALAEAEKLAQKAKSLADKLGSKQPEQAAPMTTLAFIQMLRSNVEQAEKTLREALTMTSADHPDATSANMLLFALLVAQDRTNEANAILEHALPEFAKKAIKNTQEELGDARTRAWSIICVNNLKQIGLAFRMWALDHEDKFPFNVALANGGTLELCSRGEDGLEKNPVPHFMVMSNELSSTRILTCPVDAARTPAIDFPNLTLTNVSYQVVSGSNCNPDNTNQVLIICPIHGHALDCGGVVRQASPQGKPKNATGE